MLFRSVSLDNTGPMVWIGTAPWPLTVKTVTTIPGLGFGDESMIPTFWSRDGRWLSGYVEAPSGVARGHALFDVDSRALRRLNDDSDGTELAWLPGFRNVVYFGPRGRLVMQDIETRGRRDVTGALPFPPEDLQSIVAAPDGRTLYYGAKQTEANIWMVKRPQGGTVARGTVARGTVSR